MTRSRWHCALRSHRGCIPRWDQRRPERLIRSSSRTHRRRCSCLAPADGTVTACAVSLVDSLIRLWRNKTAVRAPMERLLVVIDDLPTPPRSRTSGSIVGNSHGLGVNLIASVQASSQLGTVYGSACADELRDIFPAAVIMYGAREPELLAAAEGWSGLTTRRPETYSQADGHSYLHSELGPGCGGRNCCPATVTRPGYSCAAPRARRWKSRTGHYFSRTTTRRFGTCCRVGTARAAAMAACWSGCSAGGGSPRPIRPRKRGAPASRTDPGERPAMPAHWAHE